MGGPLLDYNDAKRALEPPAERALANDATTAPGIDRKQSSVSPFRQRATAPVFPASLPAFGRRRFLLGGLKAPQPDMNLIAVTGWSSAKFGA